LTEKLAAVPSATKLTLYSSLFHSGPLHRPPNLVNLRKNILQGDESFESRKRSRKTFLRGIAEGDETLVSYVSLREAVTKRGNLTTRVVALWFVLGALCIVSFATTNLILDTFQLRPSDIAQASQHSLNSQVFETNINPSQRFAEMRTALLRISDEEALSTLHTPQLKALDWLANRDGMQLKVDAPNLAQRYALAVMFYSTTEAGVGWKRQLNWLSDKHECEWSDEGGVRACSANKEIVDLALWNNLKGRIPTELFQLSHLKKLYLARNSLHGTIPTEIGLLTDLEYLGLHHNLLTGTVPSKHLGSLTNLNTIHLEKNHLEGTIRRVDPLCQLKTNAKPGPGKKLKQVTSDCKSITKWKPSKVSCGCCTKCYL
jgi:hypothetical protein